MVLRDKWFVWFVKAMVGVLLILKKLIFLENLSFKKAIVCSLFLRCSFIFRLKNDRIIIGAISAINTLVIMVF